MEGADFILASAWSHESEMVVARRRYYGPDSYDHTESEAEEIQNRLRKRFRVRRGSAYWSTVH